MKFIAIVIISFVFNNSIKATRIGKIKNGSLMLIHSSNVTINASTCYDCLCAMLTNTENFTIVSFNCFTQHQNGVICQMFTERDYQISPSYRIKTSYNSTLYFLQLPSEMTTTEDNTAITSTNTFAISTATTTTRVPLLGIITQPGDIIIGLYNTTAGKSTGGKNGKYTNGTEFPDQAIDQSTTTKYVNYGATGGWGTTVSEPGAGTGFYVTPAASSVSVAIGLRFATANDVPNRDPITVTLEGSNSDALDVGSSWTLIYNGPTGISPNTDPGRMQYVPQQNFSNTIAYKSYRLLITSQRGLEWAVQYSEAQIIGYV